MLWFCSEQMVYKEPLFLEPVPLSLLDCTPNQLNHFRMMATISLYVILVAAVLALGDGASLPTDNREEAQKSGYHHYFRYHHPYHHYQEEAQKGNILELNVEMIYSQPAEPGIVLHCQLPSLCLPTENNDVLSEMDDIQRALNQAAAPSSKNFNINTLSYIAFSSLPTDNREEAQKSGYYHYYRYHHPYHHYQEEAQKGNIHILELNVEN